MMPMRPGAPTIEDRFWLPVDNAAAAGAGRRAAAGLAAEAGLSDSAGSSLALVVTELATNLARHADEGTMVLRLCRLGDQSGVEVAAFDRGPGMADFAESSRDGHSTGGTLGIGLGAISRMATSIDSYTLPGRGTVIVASIWEADWLDGAWMSGVRRPIPGESVCGDGYAGRDVAGRRQLLLCDGLGHGAAAAAAAQAMVNAFADAPPLGPRDLLAYLHEQIRGTRGAVVAIAELEADVPTVRFAGVGNVSAYTVAGDKRRVMVCLPGILGHQVREIREFTYVWPPDGVLVMHSDGLTDRWDPKDYPGLTERSPAVIALALLRDAGRRRDDASVVVASAP